MIRFEGQLLFVDKVPNVKISLKQRQKSDSCQAPPSSMEKDFAL